MRKNFLITTMFVTIFLTSIALQFDVSAETGGNETLVYNEFFKVIGAEAQYNQIISIMINQLKQGFGASLKDSLTKVEDANPEKKEAFIKLMDGVMDRYFKRLTAYISEEMPFSQLAENIYIPVYQKHFSIKEIVSITEFFEGPIGSKFVSTSPQLMQESVALFNQQYGQKIQEISMKIAEEELSAVESELKKLNE